MPTKLLKDMLQEVTCFLISLIHLCHLDMYQKLSSWLLLNLKCNLIRELVNYRPISNLLFSVKDT